MRLNICKKWLNKNHTTLNIYKIKLHINEIETGYKWNDTEYK